MGIILICLALAAVGLFLIKSDWTDSGVMLIVIGGACLVMSLILLPILQSEGKTYLNTYTINRAVFEGYVANNEISGMERTKAIELATTTNIEISENKMWRNNFWVGIFVYPSIGDLEPFDISRLPKAKND